MRRLCLLGLNHQTAPLEVREKLVFDEAQTREAIAAFRAVFPDCEIVVLSTCNRVELYTTAPSDGPLTHEQAWADSLRQWLADHRQLQPDIFASALYHKSGQAAMEHLFAVAASLDSMVLGEAQILGQVKTAYELSRQLGAAGPILHPLFQRAAAVGKEVQSTTSLGEGRVSVASVAVDYAKRIFDVFTDKTVLCIGAGKMSSLVLQNLSTLQPKRLIVCNRDGEKARALAARFHGESAVLSHLVEHLVAADIVVTGTGSPVPLITRKMFDAVMPRRKYRPVFMIDIALPRDIESAVGELDNVYLYNLDDLQQTVTATHGQRREAIDAAEKIVAEHARQFLLSLRARELGPTIDKLYQRYHAMAQDELDRTLSSFGNLTPEQRAQLQEVVRRLVNKVLHDPVRTLRQSENLHGPTAQYLHALEMLFQLKDEESPAENMPK
jgi:glutamyl-tRNA reductase